MDNKWQEYEEKKREFIKKIITPEDFSEAIKKLAKELSL